MKIEFFVPGNPKTLKRHRTFTRGNFTGQYDPSKGDKKDFLAKCIEHKPDVPLAESIHLDLMIHFARPKSHYRTGKNAGKLKENAPTYHTGTPDLDNVVKMIGDSLNGIFWKDDRYISSIRATKIYSDVPGIKITISSHDDTVLPF